MDYFFIAVQLPAEAPDAGNPPPEPSKTLRWHKRWSRTPSGSPQSGSPEVTWRNIISRLMKKDKPKKTATKKNGEKIEVAKIVVLGDGACGKVYNFEYLHIPQET